MTNEERTPRNLLQVSADEARAAELFELLACGPGLRIERIVSRGQTTADDAWYDQQDDEWVVLLAGRATLRFDGVASDEPGAATGPTDVQLQPGDWLLIPAHCRHRVISTSAEPPCVWLAVHGALGAVDGVGGGRQTRAKKAGIQAG